MKEEMLLMLSLQEQGMSDEELQLIRMRQKYRKNWNHFHFYNDTDCQQKSEDCNSQYQN